MKFIIDSLYIGFAGFVLARVKKPQFPLTTAGISSAYYIIETF